MSCGWCGHGHCPACGYGHCHHYGYGYGPPPWPGYGPGYEPRRRRRRALEEEDLAAYLEDLQEEVSRVREDLESLRGSRPAEEG
jgi:hypothetical protein